MTEANQPQANTTRGALFWIAIAIWLALLAGFVPRQLVHIFGGAA